MFEKLFRKLNPEYRSKRELRKENLDLRRKLELAETINTLQEGMLFESRSIDCLHVEVTQTDFEKRKLDELGIGAEHVARRQLFKQVREHIAENMPVTSYYEPYECRHVYQAYFYYVMREQEEEKR